MSGLENYNEEIVKSEQVQSLLLKAEFVCERFTLEHNLPADQVFKIEYFSGKPGTDFTEDKIKKITIHDPKVIETCFREIGKIYSDLRAIAGGKPPLELPKQKEGEVEGVVKETEKRVKEVF